MKVILFCQNAYAFEIMKPIKEVLIERGHRVYMVYHSKT